MPNDNIITDDYVAEVLADEAANHALRYSSMGMEGLRSDKKPANMPKPNKRFLQRIIKSTNTHNANLLASEAAESQARLKNLEKEEQRQKRKEGAPQDIRRRQMGDIKAILGGGGRPLSAKAGSSSASAERSPRRGHRDERSQSPGRESSRKQRRHADEDLDSDREAHRKRRSERRRRSHSPERREKRRQRRSRSPPEEKEDLMSRSHRSGKGRSGDSRLDRDSKSRRHRSSYERDGQRGDKEDSSRSKSHRRVPKEDDRRGETDSISSTRVSRRRSREQSCPYEAESDPLEDIVGPAPPPLVRKRGRGFQSTASGIDQRFEADYDPKTDVEMSEDNVRDANNWDDAVESFRDRMKWQQNQEQRMRGAGFGDEEIARWKKGGQPNEEDVRWSKAGEKREWDRGKEGELKGLFSHDD